MAVAAITASALVIIAGLAHHAFVSWLELRERERLSATDKSDLKGEIAELRRLQNEFKNTLANLPRR